MPHPTPRRLAVGLLALALPALSITALDAVPASGTPLSTAAAGPVADRAIDRATDPTADLDAKPAARPAAKSAARPAARKARANRNPAFVSVWVDNVENLETASERPCRGDWQDLVSSMRQSRLKPDVFIVQQVSGSRQLASYTAYLTDRLGERYRSVIANPSPAKQKSPCGSPKAYQTNAVIYRDRRFDDARLGSRTWRADRLTDQKCTNNRQDRSQAVKVQLYDAVAMKNVVVGSIHWPTSASGGPPCAKENAQESVAELREDGYTGSLYLIGGDTNYGDRGSSGGFRSWHLTLRRGHTDAIYAACGGATSCLRDNATVGSGSRIDYLFAANASGPARVESGHTLTFAEADRLARRDTGRDDASLSYSDHQAVTAKVYY